MNCNAMVIKNAAKFSTECFGYNTVNTGEFEERVTHRQTLKILFFRQSAWMQHRK
jgi:hypothetical protein